MSSRLIVDKVLQSLTSFSCRLGTLLALYEFFLFARRYKYSITTGIPIWVRGRYASLHRVSLTTDEQGEEQSEETHAMSV